jgi:hypothetical protein
MRLIAFLLKEATASSKLILPGMHLDADDEARVAQQRILQLAEAQELRLALVFAPAPGWP